MTSGGALKMSGSVINAFPFVDLAGWSDQSNQANMAVNTGGTVNIRPIASGATAASAASSASNGEVKSPDGAQTMKGKDIVDQLTTARKYPEYPGNGRLESANKTGVGMISHDTTSQAEDVYNEVSGANQGNVNPSYQGGSYDTLPDTPTNRDPNISATDPGKPVPSPHDLSAKISKYFTLGMLTQAKHSHKIPPGSYQSVCKNMILLANNVLDPIKEKFPDIIITSVYRNNSSNHITGRAVDIVVESRSMEKHAEIARYARDNLPVDQVFIEKNVSGRTHVHLRVSESGAKVTPRVMTCGDAKCQSNTPGIDVGWLARRAV